MKALVVLQLFGVASVSYAQFSMGQYGSSFGNFGGAGSQSSFQPFYQNSQFGTGSHNSFASSSNPFDLFSSNSLNSNNLFGQHSSSLGRSAAFQTAPQNTFNTYSGYPFVNNQPSSGFFPSQYSSPTNFNYQQPRSQSFSFPQSAQAPQQSAYQAPAAPVNQFSTQVQHSYPPAPAAPSFQAPPPASVNYQQPSYQAPPQPSYQPPAPQYNPPQQPAYRAPAPVNAPRSAPYINTAQLSYNAAAGPGGPVRAATPNDPNKPVIVHPPAPVHYVSIGEKLEGDYKFGYETGKGSNGDESFRTESRDADGTVRGSYGYVDPSGKQITVHYEAGREGFKILSEGEVKGGSKRAPTPAPLHNHQPALPVAPVAPEPLPPPPAATEASPSADPTQTTPQRRRKRRPSQ